MIHHILITDDEAEARFSLPLPLEDAGYDVAVAADGQEAFDLIRSGAPVDLLILDIEMPRMTGLQLLDALNGIDLHLPCIVISGYGDKATIVELLRRGVDDFLDKPFKENELLQAIEQVSSKWRLRAERHDDDLEHPFTDLIVESETETATCQAAAAKSETWCIDRSENSCLLHFRQGVQADQAEALRLKLLEHLDHGDRHFICDLEGLDDLPPAILSVLLRFADLLAEQKLPRLLLRSFGSHLSQFFHITNADSQFHIELEDTL